MNIHILCLNILLMLFTISPVLLIGIMSNFPGITVKKDDLFFAKVLSYLLVIEVIFILIIRFDAISFKLPINIYWYIASVGVIPLIILLEIGIAYLIIKLQGKEASKISFWSSKVAGSNNKLYIFTVVTAICEELIFRGMWTNLLVNDFNLNAYLSIGIIAIIYGFNHLFMGSKVIVQKTFTGFIYGLLYIFSGSIIIPILTHSIQNYIVTSKGEIL